jgi:hypothetical protein
MVKDIGKFFLILFLYVRIWLLLLKVKCWMISTPKDSAKALIIGMTYAMCVHTLRIINSKKKWLYVPASMLKVNEPTIPVGKEKDALIEKAKQESQPSSIDM